LHRLASAFVLGYHGCDLSVAEKVLAGADFNPSRNDYDWLGPGIYFWEADPIRGLAYATGLKSFGRNRSIKTPAVIGAVIDLGLCLDLTTSAGVQQARNAYQRLLELTKTAGGSLPRNSPDQMRRKLDCAVIRTLHDIRKVAKEPPIDTVRGVFIEGDPAFEGSGIYEKTHIQICVCTPECIKDVFRVPQIHLS
jgi:hypothetical protein